MIVGFPKETKVYRDYCSERVFLWVALLGLTIFLGALLRLEMLAVVLAGLIAFIYASCSISTSSTNIQVCLWLLLLQNFLIGTGAHLGGNSSDSLSLLTQVPFILILILFICRYVNGTAVRRSNSLKTPWIWVLLVLIGALFFIGGSSITSKLVAIRNLLMFYMGYVVAYDQCQMMDDPSKMLKQIVRVSAFAVIFGIFMLAQPVSFWQQIGLTEVYIAKQSPIVDGTMGGRFYTSLDGVTDLLRMGSLYYEPVNLSYLLLSGMCASAVLIRNKKTGIALLVLLSIGYILTFGKGGFIFLAFLLIVCLAYLLLSKLGNTESRRMKLTVYFACVLALGVIAYAYYIFVGGPVRPHFWALEQTMGSIIHNPIGHGLGTGGNMSDAGSDYSRGAESAVMTIGYQIGIIGIIGVFMLLLAISSKDLNALYLGFWIASLEVSQPLSLRIAFAASS